MRLMFDCGYPIIIHKIFKEYYWFGYYRDAKKDILPNIPEERVSEVSISMFVDADLAKKKFTRHSQTGVLIFMNKNLI